MKKEYIFRTIFWGIIMICSLGLGIFGMIEKDKQLSSNKDANFLSSSKPIWVNKTVKSISTLLKLLQILSTSLAASLISIREPISPSPLV